eukprot:TRINITY_DN33153_c0_g1_i1.p1 TRINITY_DN33153_c0_g1~~TRINITY_DN33153_c0_g1_i1.p1  ORF type:complete len:599 (+),score=91.67 TRINITY_DN33153_c0_g1_i1:63-1859(+)
MAVPSSPSSKSDPGSEGSSQKSTFGYLDEGVDGAARVSAHLNEDSDVNDMDVKRTSWRSLPLDPLMSASLQETPKVVSSFFDSSLQLSFQIEDDEPNAKLRRCLYGALRSPFNTLFMLVLIIVDFAISCADTDLRAAGREVPSWMEALVYSCLVFYSAELSLKIFVFRSELWNDKWWTLLDFTICSAGVIDAALKLGRIEQTSAAGGLRLMRLARAFRMLRILHGFAHLQELKRLVQMAANCAKTLLWSFLFSFIVMTSWSLIAVELVHPLVQELGTAGQWDNCDDCLDAFSTIFHSNLTLFSTIVAGDSWGKIAIPVMKAYPGSSFFFVGAHLTLVYGVLNLIVAVVVDTFAEQRSKDESRLAHELEEDHAQDTKEWTKVFREMDSDGDGTLSLDELMDAARNLKEFRARLRILDIDENDLTQLFHMLDSDCSGDIERDEFIGALVRWKHESKSASRFVKYNMERSLRNEDELLKMQEFLASRCRSMEKSLQMLCDEARASLMMDRAVSGATSRQTTDATSRQATGTTSHQTTDALRSDHVRSMASARKPSEKLDSLVRPRLRDNVAHDPAVRVVADDEPSLSRESRSDEHETSVIV